MVPAQALKIGGDYRGTGGQVYDEGYNDQYFRGEIANISVWSDVRTAEQIQADVQAGDGPVQIGQAGGQAWDGRLAGGQLGEPVVHIDEDVGDGDEPPGGPALADGIDPLLRGLQDVLPRLRSLLDQGGEIACGLGHPAQQSLVLQDPDVLHHVGRGGGGVHELEQIAPGGVLVVHPVLLHVLQHRHWVDGEGVIEHGVDGIVDLPVLPYIEVVGPQLVDDLRHAPGVDEHRAQHRLLRLHTVRHLPEQQLFVFHWHLPEPPLL